MDGVGKRLAEITGAEWGIITAAAAPPFRIAPARRSPGRIPSACSNCPISTGLKNEVIIPAYSRNVYDHAVRMVGVKDRRGQGSLGARRRIQRAHSDGLHSWRARR